MAPMPPESPPASPPEAVVEVFADVTCPFTHVGLHRILEHRSKLQRSTPRLRVRAWPLELVNGAPFDGATLAAKVRALRQQVAPDLFAGFDPDSAPHSTLPALALVASAYAVDAATGEAVSLAVRDACFEDGRDVSDSMVLHDLAKEHGLGRLDERAQQSVLDDYDEGRRRGVRGSPEFFLGGRGYFCPTLQIRDVNGALEITFDVDAMDEFLADLFERDRPHTRRGGTGSRPRE